MAGWRAVAYLRAGPPLVQGAVAQVPPPPAPALTPVTVFLPSPPPRALQVLPSWLTTVSLSLLLTAITAKVALKAADIRRKEQRASGRSLARLSAVDAEGGGEFLETLRTPLLSPCASLEDDSGSASGGSSRGRGGGFREASPSPVGPLLLRHTSANSSGRTSEEGGGRSGELAAAARAGSSSSTGVLLNPAAPEWRPPASEPVSIDVESGGVQAGHALPLLSPIM